MKQITVIHILKDFALGGGPRAVFHLCASMADVKFIVYGIDGAMKEEFYHLGNTEVRSINSWDIKTVYKLWKEIRHMRADVIHFHHLLPALLLGNLLPQRKVFTLHGLHIRKYDFVHAPIRRFFRRLCENIAMCSMDRLIALCPVDAKYLPRILYRRTELEKIVIIPNAIALTEKDIPTVSLPDPAGMNLLVVSRYDYPKGLDILTDMVHELEERGVIQASEATGGRRMMKIYFIGDTQVEKLVAHGDGTMQFLKRTLSPYAYMKAADYLLLPSRWEGLPMVALEALSAGTKVIAADTANIEDLEGEDVLLYRQGDSEDFWRVIQRAATQIDHSVTVDLSPYAPESVGKKMNMLYLALYKESL